jgi:tetratricopeptide (TPR) repeat protein
MHKKNDDIYGGIGSLHPHEKPDPKTGKDPAPEQWRKDYLKNKFWSFFLGLVVFVFIVAVAWLLIQNYLSMNPTSREYTARRMLREHTPIPRYGLTLSTDWVLDYDEAELDDVPPPEEGLSTIWLKRAAYHVITAEQAINIQKLDEAETHYRNALEILPDLKGIWQNLGTIQLNRQNYKEAVASFEKAVEEGELTYRLANNLGAACIGAEEYDRAEEWLLRALDLRSEYPESYKNLAILYRKKKDVDSCIHYFERYLDLRPSDLDITQAYALYLTSNAKWRKAAQLLRRLNEQLPEVAPLFFLRAQVEIQLNNTAEAVKALKRGIQLVDSSYALGWMSKNDFDVIRDTQEFQALLDRVELSDVMPSGQAQQ